MSRWTHVAAIFRLDSLGTINDEKIREIFGKEVSYEESYDYYGTNSNELVKTLPMGSEGSLNMSIWHNPNKDSLASTTVSVFGDLRDYGGSDVEEIKKWFNECCEKCFVRQAVIQIDDEGIKDSIIVECK